VLAIPILLGRRISSDFIANIRLDVCLVVEL
jgi:hypothetical protein